MKRQNRNNKNKKQQLIQHSAPMLQLSKQINLFSKQTSAMVNITLPGVIYGYSTSGLYTFTNNADVRYLAFSAVTGVTEFTNFAATYANYRIRSCSVIINPLYNNVGTSTGALQLPLLVMGCEPEDSNIGTNPVNADFIVRDRNHLFSSLSNVVKSVTFTFPSTGINTNMWYDTDNQPSRGLFYIGNNSTTNWFGGGNVLVFEYYINILVEFRNIK